MKRLMLLLALALAFACNAPTSSPSTLEATTETATTDTIPTTTAQPVAATKDVLHYYRSLPSPWSIGHPLKQQNGKWMTQSNFTEEPFEVAVVDVKNGYIEFTDPGTGGGDLTYQFVLFRMADGAPVIGITKTFFDGAGIDQTYYFLRPEDPKQIDWTDYTLPEIDGFSFLRDDSAEEERIVRKLLPVTIELPRVGTTAKAKVFTGLKDIYCRGDQNEYSDYCVLFDQLQRTEIALRWNKEMGRFER
jgi:hypothetical protein